MSGGTGDGRRHPLELRVPPVVVFAVAWLAQTASVTWLDLPRLTGPWSPWVDRAGILLAVSFGVAAVVQFARMRTTVDPHRPERASTLVDTGLYAFTRNPMYLALLLILVKEAVASGDAPSVLVAVGFVLWMNRFQIGPEERILAGIFGDEYEAYRRRVRRWI